MKRCIVACCSAAGRQRHGAVAKSMYASMSRQPAWYCLKNSLLRRWNSSASTQPRLIRNSQNAWSESFSIKVPSRSKSASFMAVSCLLREHLLQQRHGDGTVLGERELVEPVEQLHQVLQVAL